MMTAVVRSAAVAAIALGTACAVASCSSAAGSPHRASTHGGSAAPAATRWWSNGAASAGSTLSAGKDSAAQRLQPSRAEYCTMLRQTVAAGRSILRDAGTTAPAVTTATKAFVAEVKAVAPAEVSTAWQTLGNAVVSLVAGPDGAAAAQLLGAPAVQHASAIVVMDAKARCHVDLTRVGA
jgi:hypothetical protein